MSAKVQSSDQSVVKRSIRPVAVSTILGAAVCVVFLLLMSLVVSTRNIPHSMIDPMALFAVSVGAFVAGLSCGKILRGGGLIYGAACGAIMVFIVLTAGMSVGETGLGVPALFRMVFILLSSMLGGVLGVNMKKRKK